MIVLPVADGDQLYDQRFDVGDAEDLGNGVKAGPLQAAQQVPGADGGLECLGWCRGYSRCGKAWQAGNAAAGQPGRQFFAVDSSALACSA